MTLKVNARIVLAVDGAIMCLMACAFGIKYDEIQKGIKDTIASMLVTRLVEGKEWLAKAAAAKKSQV